MQQWGMAREGRRDEGSQPYPLTQALSPLSTHTGIFSRRGLEFLHLQAKPHLDLLHFSHMTPCHVSYAMSSFITCVSLARYSSHFHKCTCRLITCVSHINTYQSIQVVTQLPKRNKDLLISPFLVIDDNSTKIWKISSNGFELLAQAILPCVNDFGQVAQTRIGSISSPYICARVFGLKLAIYIDQNCGRVITTNDAKV